MAQRQQGASAGKVRVHIADARADAADWDRFVAEHPDASFFHQFGWRHILEDVFRHRTFYLCARVGDALVAIYPLAEVRSRLFGHSLVSLPFCVYAGPVGEPSAVAALEARAEALAAELGVAHLEVRGIRSRHEDWPRQSLYVTFRKRLSGDHDENMAAIPRKQRAMVRKGIKNGLEARIDDTVDDFFALYADNVRRHGTPALPKRYFQALRDTFGAQCDVLTVRDAAGTAHSSVLSFYFRDEVLPYYAGDALSARGNAANDYKYWALMCRAVDRGCRTFDYGRSKQGTGQFAFKKNWGFEPVPLAYEYQLYRRAAIPQHNPANPKYRTLIALWRRLPLTVANALGPHIVRNLG